MFRSWQLAELEQVLSAQLVGADVAIKRVHSDSRSLQKGDLFVALRGDNFDGHNYLAQAAELGAAAALVENLAENVQLPQLLVADTRRALGLLGQYNRASFNGKLLALTGSSGKTTVKELLASIGRCAYGQEQVLATEGNLNNELGVPMTLLRLSDAHRFAVIELGASTSGEIAWTRSLAKPDVVLINNAGLAHAGEFGGAEAIVAAKGEILDELSGQATAVLNLDDAAFEQWQARCSAGRVLSFALENPQADVYAQDIAFTDNGCASFMLHTPEGQAQVQLQLAGKHNLANALAAAAGAHAAGIQLEHIAQGLSQASSISGRCQQHELSHGGILLDDSYNANPSSMRAGIDLLAAMPGQRILILADMAELGQWASNEHHALGKYANGKADVLLAFGPQMQHAVASFNGMAQHFASQQELLDVVKNKLTLTTSYLVKGSRSTAMETVVTAILAADRGDN